MSDGAAEKKIFTLIVILYPVLFVYPSGISSLMISDVILILYVIYLCFFGTPRGTVVNKYVLMYFLICILQIIVQYISGVDYSSDNLMQALRFLMYIFTVMAIAPKHFAYEYGRKMVMMAGRIIAIIAILQFVCVLLFHFYIAGILPFLFKGELTVYTNGISSVSGISRVSSVFVEPAHLAAYLTLPMTIILFDNRFYSRKDFIIFLMGIIASISSTAYIITGVILILRCIIKQDNQRISTNELIMNIAMISFLAVVFLIFYKMGGFEIFTERTFVNKGAVEGRMGGYSANIVGDQSFNKVFGKGFVEVEGYLASYPCIYYRFGIIGITSWIVMCIGLFVSNRDIVKRILLIVFSILGIGTMSLVSYMIIFYISFVVCEANDQL